MNYYYYYDGRRGSFHRHRTRNRDGTTHAYAVAREPGWARFPRLGVGRTGSRGGGGPRAPPPTPPPRFLSQRRLLQQFGSACLWLLTGIAQGLVSQGFSNSLRRRRGGVRLVRHPDERRNGARPVRVKPVRRSHRPPANGKEREDAGERGRAKDQIQVQGLNNKLHWGPWTPRPRRPRAR